LLTGGRCSEVAVSTGLTVLLKKNSQKWKNETFYFLRADEFQADYPLSLNLLHDWKGLSGH
jgi:hypothetical protein